MQKYNHKKIEKKWQKIWAEHNSAKIDKDDQTKEKYYILDMFPYPSGDGLHMGHAESYTASDVFYRYKKMRGFSVLHPQGFDAFGLPTENYALQTGIKPAEITRKNVGTYTKQMQSLGLNYDFDEKVVTSEPTYYKWTQWLFCEFYKNGLVYKKTSKINWCESCQTGIANEQVLAGKCERCGTDIIQKEIPGWFFKITNFADDLINDLDKVDWPEHTKKNQRNWIGKSEGALIKFPISHPDGRSPVRGDNFQFPINSQFSNDQKTHIIFVHGSSARDERTDKNYIEPNVRHFQPEIIKNLVEKGFKVDNPIMPKDWDPKYEEWKGVIDKLDVNENTIAVGTSAGGTFWVRWLAETGKKIKKLILVAPGKICEAHKDERLTEFYNFDIPSGLKEKITGGVSIFISLDDGPWRIESANLYKDKLNANLIKFEDRKHFCSWQNPINIKFPELLEEILRFSASSPHESATSLEVFTTRPDTLFGATYMVLAPEHKLLTELKEQITNWVEVEKYIKETQKKTELDRVEAKEKTGIKLEGVVAINPAFARSEGFRANDEKIPIFVADYVLAGYGTGAIMAVPAHDERDFEFAKKYNLPIKEVVLPVLTDTTHPPRPDKEDVRRTNVNTILFNPKNKKYAFLKWNADLGWTTTIGGGLKKDENCEEAGRRELLEETGYKNVKFIRKIGNCIGRGFAKHKDVNRISDVIGLYFELENEDREDVDEKEKKQHEVVWLDESEVKNFLNMPTSIYIWELFRDCNSVYSGSKGELINSKQFDGMNSEEAKQKITEFVGGEITSNYRLRDWSISRQRYWGCPIPIVYSPDGEAQLVPEKYLPWKLPEDVDFKPTGESPLTQSAEFKKRTEEIFGEGWTPEYDTLDTFVDSSWYFLRYPDVHNSKEFCSQKRMKRWLPVDLYIGGAEHTYMHLLFARFFVKAMRKIGLLNFDEPFLKLRHQGMVLDKVGKKMSKSKGNVVNPDEMVKRFGADTVRTYMLFAAPLEDDVAWNENNIVGVYRFLEKIWKMDASQKTESSLATQKSLHKTIKKVGQDIEDLKYNTAISEMMKFVNAARQDPLAQADFEKFLKILAPFAPHIAEELWHSLRETRTAADGTLANAGKIESIHLENWPEYDAALAKDETHLIAVQVNGKVRAEIEIEDGLAKEEAQVLALADEKVQKWLVGKEIKKVIFVENKILNIVL